MSAVKSIIYFNLTPCVVCNKPGPCKFIANFDGLDYRFCTSTHLVEFEATRNK